MKNNCTILRFVKLLTRSVKSLLCLSFLISVSFYTVELVIGNQVLIDSNVINCCGSLRYLSQKLSFDLIMHIHDYRPNSTHHSINDIYTNYKKIDKVSLALINDSFKTQQCFKVNDDENVNAIIVWRKKLKQFKQQYLDNGINAYYNNMKYQSKMISYIKEMIIEVDIIVDDINGKSNKRSQTILHIIIMRIVVLLIINTITIHLFCKLWAPYIKLYENEQQAKEIIKNNENIIEHQENTILEYKQGYLEPKTPIIEPKTPIIEHKSVSECSSNLNNSSCSSNTINNFNGHWVLIQTNECRGVNEWLTKFTIDGYDVIDGCGDNIQLKQKRGIVYFEGGELTIISGVLYRKGKSGITLSYKNAV